jgi:hypothetical protein
MKTAVEWLEDYIQKEINKYSMQPMDLHAIHALNHIKEFACSKAKEMEKEQSIELIREAVMFMASSDFDEDIAKMTFEDIYETFKQQE